MALDKKLTYTIAHADVDTTLTAPVAKFQIHPKWSWPTDVDDDFTDTDGADPNRSLWDILVAGASTTIQSNELELSLTNADDESVVRSTYKLPSDFSIQIDFDISVRAGGSGMYNQFMASTGDDSASDQLYIDYSLISAYKYRAGARKAGSWDTVQEVTINEYTGKFKITRTGSNATMEYWNGSSFTTLATATGFTTDDLYIVIRGKATTTHVVGFDNFVKNSGTIVWPYTAPTGCGKDNFDASEVFEQLNGGNDSFTKLLIHSDETDESTTFVDSSPSEHTITPYSAIEHSTDQSKFGGSSISIPTTGDYLKIADSPDWDLGTEDFTMEWWEYCTLQTANSFVFCREASYSSSGFQVGGQGGGKRNYSLSSNGSTNDIASSRSMGTIALNTWQHVALVRVGTKFISFLNGIQQDTITSSASIYATPSALFIGRSNYGTTIRGYIDEPRFTKGLARWTTNFDPPERVYDKGWKQLAITHKVDDVHVGLLAEIENPEEWVNKKATLNVRLPDVSTSENTVIYVDYTLDNDDQSVRTLAQASDDFTGTNGDAPNPLLWSELLHDDLDGGGSDGTGDIQGNSLSFSIPAGVKSLPYFYQRCTYSDDFDVQVDFSLDTWTETDNNQAVGLVISSSPAIEVLGASYLMSMNRYGNVIADYNSNYQGETATNINDNAHTSGKFRITRVGSTWTSYYWDGSGWAQVKQKTSGSTVDVYVILFARVFSTFYGQIDVSFDNFTVNSADSIFGFIGEIGSVPGQAVWGSDFAFVSQQAQDPSGTAPQILDSTSRGKHGTSYGTMLTEDLVDFQLGKALDYDGTDDYTNHGYDADHDITDVLTIRAIITPSITLDSSLTSQVGIVGRQNDPTDDDDSYALGINTDGKLALGSKGGNIQSTKASWTSGQTYHVVATFNSTGLVGDLFVDGVKETLSVDNFDTMAGSTNNLVIGKDADASTFFPGIIDEVAIINAVMSDDWVEFDYLSHTDSLFAAAYNADIIRVLLNQSYDLVPQLIRTIFNQIYSLTEKKRNVLQQVYSLRMLVVFIQRYGEVERLRTALHQWYWEATQIRTSLEQEYDEAPSVRNSLEQTYHIYHYLITKLNQVYSITGGDPVRQSLLHSYDLKDVDIIRVRMNQIYALLDGTTTFTEDETPTVVTGIRDDPTSGETPGGGVPGGGVPSGTGTVTWTTEEISFVSFSISASLGQYVITCTAVLGSFADYVRLPFKTDVQIVHGGTTYNFFVKNRTKDTEFGKGAYSVELISPTAMLDTPYSRPLTDADKIDSSMDSRDLVELMASKQNITVDYQLLNWEVKGSAISVVGKTPLGVIRSIVNPVGGIVQSKPNGDMLIISKYPISPPLWASSTPDIVLTLEGDIDGITESFNEREGYNAFIISEQSSADDSITLEPETVDETTKIIKGYRVPFNDGPFPLHTSGGSDISINKDANPVSEQVPPTNAKEGEEWEVIEFIDWQGQTSKPIYSIVDIDWIQDELTDDIGVPPLSVLDITEAGLLTVMDTDNVPSESLLRIKYMTKYWKWTVTGPIDIPVQFYVPELEEE